MFDIDLKQKLRDLKRAEQRMRCRYLTMHPNAPLVWNAYFSTKSPAEAPTSIKYPFTHLCTLDRDARRRVFEEFMCAVFLQHAQEEGFAVIMTGLVYQPELLSFMGLPPYATPEEIKKRFRELAHQFHPDKGGDSEKMIRLLELYEQFSSKKRV
ncbi:heat shock protein DnaJ domain protein [Candidatus Moduliflexus flocculans]|uniref:Heat shock protein DnaJ domain protein n=1 Tax=Candidatus Moduliflexus flocculans TaxID=1499966 RepID=A0A081BSL8_9BACT|nr:heat shock protein DnaJ domain protein [Candidatus Moduliflexus flocculans]